MIKKYFNDPSILFLIGGNIYCIWYYENHPGSFSTIVWIYWFQSITIGLFNFLGLLTLKNYNDSDFTMNDKPVTGKTKGCAAWFFLFHFGMFHFVYAIFLLVDIGISSVNNMVLLLGVSAFFLESIVNFIRQKQIEQSVKPNIGTMFFMPYLRIIPMHMMILLPAIFGWKPSMLFLGLKMGADILSYLLYRNINSRKVAIPT